jgi:hypothetical protein
LLKAIYTGTCLQFFKKNFKGLASILYLLPCLSYIPSTIQKCKINYIIAEIKLYNPKARQECNRQVCSLVLQSELQREGEPPKWRGDSMTVSPSSIRNTYDHTSTSMPSSLVGKA